jgi:general secretion pathway protein H
MTPISACDINRQRGFTLLELLLVLGILGMAALLITPGLRSLDAPGFNAQVREASGLLNYARRMAVVQGQPTSIAFFPAQPDDEQLAATSATGQWVARELTVSYRDSTGRQYQVGERLLIEFYPEGGSTGGELRFAQADRQAIIHVDPFSGRVSLRHDD